MHRRLPFLVILAALPWLTVSPAAWADGCLDSLGQPPEAVVDACSEEIEAAGGRAAAEELADQQTAAAAAALERLPIGPDERALFEAFAVVATAREA